MKEHSILFSGPMILAILEGRKTMTRRIVKQATDKVDPMPPWAICRANQSGWIAWYGKEPHDPNIEDFTRKAYEHGFDCPYGTIGDQLWVRESFCVNRGSYEDPDAVCYKADNSLYFLSKDDDNELHLCVNMAADDFMDPGNYKWKPSIHMPRWASRLTLEITGIRVERLQEITEEDARAEGVEPRKEDRSWTYRELGIKFEPHREAFETLWDSINSKRAPWSSNPWVWVVEFKRIAQ